MWLRYALTVGVAVCFISSRCLAQTGEDIIACVNLLGDAVCEPLAARGDCETSPDWMVLRCRHACHACRSFGCYDTDGLAECQQIASNEVCRLARDYMLCHCRQRCGLCLAQHNFTCTNKTNDQVRPDCSNTAGDVTCNTLVLEGACLESASPRLGKFVTEHCALACGFCAPTSALTSTPNSTTSATVASTTNDRLSDSECRDLDQWADYCAMWAADGQCTRNPLLMATYCARTCNVCQILSAASVTQPVSRVSTTQHSTPLGHTHDGINTSTTLRHSASSPVFTRSSVNAMSNNSLLTLIVSSVSVSATLAGNTVSGVTTQASLDSELNSTFPVRTDTRTMSSAGATLLSLMISADSGHEMMSASNRAAAANETGARRSVTSSYTGLKTDIASLRRASLSSLSRINSEMWTVARRRSDVTGTSTTAHHVFTSVTGSTANDSRLGLSHSVDQVATSTTVTHVTPVTPTHVTDQVHIAITSDDHFTTSAVDANLSSSFNNTRHAGLVTTATHVAHGHVNTSVTSQTDVISAAAAADVSRPGVMTSSSRDPANVTSNNNVSDTAVELFTRLIAADDDSDDDDSNRPHTTPAVAPLSASSRYTLLRRHSQSDNTVKMSIINMTNSSDTNSSSTNSGAQIDLTSSANLTHDRVGVSATYWSRDNSSSSITPTVTSARRLTARLRSIADDLRAITNGVFSNASDTVTTTVQVPSSKQTTESRRLNSSSFHGTLMSAHASSDRISTESISSPSSSSEQLAVWVTEKDESVKSGTKLSAASRLDTRHFSFLLTSISNVSTPHTTAPTTVNSSAAGITRQARPSIARPSFSSLVTSRPVVHHSTVTSLYPPSAHNSDLTLNISHLSLTSVNISSNYSTHQVTEPLSTANVNVTDFIRASSTSSSNVTTSHQAYDELTQSTTFNSRLLMSSQLHVSEPIKSTTASHPHSSSSTSSDTTSAAIVSVTASSTRSRPLRSTRRGRDTNVRTVTPRRSQRGTADRPVGTLTQGRLRAQGGHVIIDIFTADRPPR